MLTFEYILMGFLVVCAISVSFSKNLLNSVLIFMSYSLVMSIIWILLESPDLAITEAAVGAGVTSLLFFVTLKKIHAMKEEGEAFLKFNAEQEGVVSLPSGLQYKVITEGTGKKPSATSQVKCHYEGTLLNGAKFDSSYDRNEPAVFGLN